MDVEMDERALLLGRYIVETGATVRRAAKVFCISKSTVHKDVHERLRHINPLLFSQAQAVLAYNLKVRHLRGGAATAARYRRQAETQHRHS